MGDEMLLPREQQAAFGTRTPLGAPGCPSLPGCGPAALEKRLKNGRWGHPEGGGGAGGGKRHGERGGAPYPRRKGVPRGCCLRAMVPAARPVSGPPDWARTGRVTPTVPAYPPPQGALLMPNAAPSPAGLARTCRGPLGPPCDYQHRGARGLGSAAVSSAQQQVRSAGVPQTSGPGAAAASRALRLQSAG